MSGGELTQILAEVIAARESGPVVVLATVIQSPPDGAVPVGAKLLLRQDGSSLGSLGGGPLEAAVLADSREAFRRHAMQSDCSTPRMAPDSPVSRRRAGPPIR